MADQAVRILPGGPVRRVRADRLGLRLFDDRFYGIAVGRSTESKRSLYRDFLKSGWRKGLDPNFWFTCDGYLRANPDVAQADLNPWLHFVRSGRHEQRPLMPSVERWPLAPGTELSADARSVVGPRTLEETLAQAANGLVDERYYLAAYPDVHATGGTAAEHFAVYGAEEGRAPAPWFNLEYLRTHSPSYRLGPGNPLVNLLRLTTGARLNVSEPATWWVEPDAAVQSLNAVRDFADILVIIHAYYPQDLDVFSKVLALLGPSVKVAITCPPGTARVCQRWAERDGLDATIVETINRGRDWGPFFAVASEIQHTKWRGILKLHTKRSPHRDDGAAWLAHVLSGLVPNERTVSSVLDLLADERCDILVAPGTLSSAKGWEPESRRTREVYYEFVGHDDDLRFPAGSMFWMSSRLMAKIADLPLALADFEPELGQLDGTLAHALERLVVKISTGEVGLVRDQR